MEQVQRGEMSPPPSTPDFRFTPYEEESYLCHLDGGGLLIVHETGCSCGAWARGERPCPHQKSLGQKLLAAGSRLIERGMALTGDGEHVPEVKAGVLPARCSRCGCQTYRYPAGPRHLASVRCTSERCNWRQVAR